MINNCEFYSAFVCVDDFRDKPELNAYIAESPVQFSPAISSRNSTSSGLTRPEIGEASSLDSEACFIGQLPAP